LKGCVRVEVQSPGDVLDVTAKRGEDGKLLQIQVVNVGARPIEARLRVDGFTPAKAVGQVVELSGKPEAVNTAAEPRRVVPRAREWRHGLSDGATRYTFPAHSFTVLRLE
jgi:alpha-L-arabinofuranosidase